jgi:DNA-binding NarL/FixJ family response regulator
MTYPTTPVGELTARERRALCLYAQGVPQKRIADLMHISVHTVVNHLDRCQQHLFLHNRLELKAYAKQHGLDKVEQEVPS